MNCNKSNNYINNNYENCLLEKSILSIAKYEYNFFFRKANVVGVGLGLKVINNFNTQEKCIKVFVSNKCPCNDLNSSDIIPKVYKGIKTDVTNVHGIPTVTTLRGTIRPVVGGYSISANNSLATGTLGCLVIDRNNLIYMLSCNHVLADNRRTIGTPILQTSFEFGGRCPNNIVANLSNYIPIQYMSPSIEPINFVDCAIAEVIHRGIASSLIAFIGVPSGVNMPILGQTVRKVGETTELTTGIVNGVGVSTIIQYPDGNRAFFEDQIVTSKLFTKGDSGATLLNTNNEVVGLCMSETSTSNFSNTFSNVLRSFDVELLTHL